MSQVAARMGKDRWTNDRPEGAGARSCRDCLRNGDHPAKANPGKPPVHFDEGQGPAPRVNARCVVSPARDLAQRLVAATLAPVPNPPHSPRQLFHLLDTGRMSLAEFREAMKTNALEIIEEMEEDHLNPVQAFLEQMLCRRAASKLLKKHKEPLIREMLQALSEIDDFHPARWLWNAGHPHVPLHAFFRSKREPVFRVIAMEAMPQVVTVTVEYSVTASASVIREAFRLRRDRRGQLGLELRQGVPANSSGTELLQ